MFWMPCRLLEVSCALDGLSSCFFLIFFHVAWDQFFWNFINHEQGREFWKFVHEVVWYMDIYLNKTKQIVFHDIFANLLDHFGITWVFDFLILFFPTGHGSSKTIKVLSIGIVALDGFARLRFFPIHMGTDFCLIFLGFSTEGNTSPTDQSQFSRVHKLCS